MSEDMRTPTEDARHALEHGYHRTGAAHPMQPGEIAAIAYVRDRHGMDLREAKDLVRSITQPGPAAGWMDMWRDIARSRDVDPDALRFVNGGVAFDLRVGSVSLVCVYVGPVFGGVGFGWESQARSEPAEVTNTPEAAFDGGLATFRDECPKALARVHDVARRLGYIAGAAR